MYYAAYNNTKYYLIASYFLESQQITESIKKIQQNQMKCIKVQNRLRTKIINCDSSRPSKWVYFVKKINK